MAEAEIRTVNGKTLTDTLLEVPHMVEYWSRMFLKSDTFLKEHNYTNELLESDSYIALFNKDSEGKSNIEKAILRAADLEETGEKKNTYVLNYIKQTVLSKLVRAKENIIRRQEPFEANIYSYEDLETTFVGFGEDHKESVMSMVEVRDLLNNIPNIKTGYTLLLNDRVIPVTQKNLAELLYQGYTVTDLSKIMYNSSGKQMAFNTAKKLLTDVKSNLKEYMKKYI